MKHRIRVAGLLVRGGEILLVEQQSPYTGRSRWAPPGGGLEATDTDIFAGVEREVLEETGLPVRAGRLRFVSEFLHLATDTLMLEMWIDCHPAGSDAFGTPHLQNLQPSDGILDVQWWSEPALRAVAANRPLLHPQFWPQLSANTSEVLHLGRWEE